MLAILRALPLARLRHTLLDLFEDAINEHLLQDRLHTLKVAEDSERDLLRKWAVAAQASVDDDDLYDDDPDA